MLKNMDGTYEKSITLIIGTFKRQEWGFDHPKVGIETSKMSSKNILNAELKRQT